MLKELFKGLKYLHCSKNICHRDVKVSNICVSKIGTFGKPKSEKKLSIKLIDFGYAQSSDDVNQNILLGTRHYMAPELFEDRQLTLDELKAVDIWASGVLAFFLLSGQEFPFDSTTEEEG